MTSVDDDAPTRLEPASGPPPSDSAGPRPSSSSDADTQVEPNSGDSAAADDLRLPPRIGRYTLIRKLGEGGMGSVYMAFDEELARPVALKLLLPRIRESASVRTRMQREAQALARISHPNVVQIYDVGRFAGRLYVAMELIEGTTLRAWRIARRRGWRDVQAVMLQAGEGLAAAHRVGLVHRDIKPDNILVGDDGRVRVADFGLARAEQASDELTTHEEPEQARSPEVSTSSSALDAPLTVAGTLLGTPAYMAPEQHMRREVDARADVFAFAIVLYEALFGRRPFAGKSRVELARATITGDVLPPPSGHAAPTWLVRVIERGLRPEPDDRYPSMEALLSDLRRDPARSRRRALLAGGALSLVVAAGYGGAELQARSLAACAATYAPEGALWGGPRRAAVQGALAALGTEHGRTTWERVDAGLAAYVGDLAGAYVDACEEHRRGKMSPLLHDLTVACLDRRRAELEATVVLLGGADQAIAERAVEAVARLPAIATCADASALLDSGAAPEDPAIAAAVDGLRARLASARAKRRIGAFTEAKEAAAALVTDAREVGYPLTIAEALLEEGLAAAELGDGARAIGELLPEALELAERSGDDQLRLDVLSGLIANLARGGGAIELLRLLAPQALALVERRGLTGGLAHGRLLLAVGESYLNFREREAAGRFLDEAVTILEGEGDPAKPDLAAAFNDLAMLRSREKRYDESHALYARSRATLVDSLGPDHPFIGYLYNNEARAFEKEGDPATAREHFERALALWVPVYGEAHENVQIVTGHLARVAYTLGDGEAARTYAARSLAIREARGGRTDAVLLILARVAADRDDLDEAALLAARAVDAAEARFGADSPNLVAPLRLRAELAVRRDDWEAAHRALSRALPLTEGSQRGAIGRDLARARWALGDRIGAREAALAALPDAPPDVASELRTWLDAHPARRRG